jgi:hypothetical protein
MEKKVLLRLVLAMLTLAVSQYTNAQLTTNYPASNHIVVTGTPYTDLGTTGSIISTLNTDDALSSAVPIGFSFTFNGASYTEFILSTNGFIKMGNVAPSSAALFYAGPQSSGAGTGGAANSTNTLDTALIIPFNHDLIGASGAEYRVSTTGSVGSRICTIQFKNLTEKNTTIAIQYAIINFQIKLYEGTNVIDFVWGPFTASTNTSAFRSALCGLKGSGATATNLLTVTKGSVTAWNLPTFQNGNYTGNALNYGNNVGSTRPLPVAGTIYRFIPVYANDIAVRQVYTLGKMPKAYTSPHFVRAAIRNSGTSASTGFYIKLQVTGANPFIDSLLVTGMNPNVDTIVTFAGHSPTTNGYDTVRVFVDPDDNSFNNSRISIRDVNNVIYSYADPSVPSAGGVGFTGASGDFVAKFPYSGVINAINQVGVNFNTGGNTLRIGIWNRNTGTGLPGTLLWQSSPFVTIAGLNTIPVNPPVAISDTFFVGVIQIGTVNAAFSFQNENPIRNQTFYYTSPTGTSSWIDFFATSSAFRFMIEPRLQSPDDMGVTDILYPCPVLPAGQPAIIPSVRIFNYGALAQTAVKIKCAIFNATGNRVYIDSTTTGTVNSGNYSIINFTDTFSTFTPGNYTIKSWSELIGDGSLVNDTATSLLTITNIPNIKSAGTFLNFDGADDHIVVANNPSISPAAELSIEAWINPTNFITNRTIVSKDSAGLNRSYRLFINTTGNLVFTVNTSSGLATAVSSTIIPTASWTHVAATFDGANLRLYVNGDTAGASIQIGTINSSTTGLYVGKNGPSVNELWVGGIDELKIWNIALTESEIRRRMHTRLPNLASTNLRLYFRFDEGLNNPILSDASGNCNSGTTVNMDVQNSTTAPAVFISTIPIGTPAVVDTLIGGSGTYVLTGGALNMNFFNYLGSENYVLHKFDTVYSTLPTVNPGGVTASTPLTWILYRYGLATYDSIYASFLLGPGYILGTGTVNDIHLFRRGNGNGGGWTLYQNPASAISTSPQSATFKFTAASQFRFQFNVAGNNNPLPVSMGQLMGRATALNAELNWEVYSELNNKGFEIERSLDGVVFEKIGFVNGRMNSNEPTLYTFIDEGIFAKAGVVGYYRIRQVDADGTWSDYSNTVRIAGGATAIHSVSVIPNPFHDLTQVSIDLMQSGSVEIQLLDINGKLLQSNHYLLADGLQTLPVRADNLQAGIYLLKVKKADETVTLKVVKSN